MPCQSCEALTINGVYCHEHGCPDAHRDTLRECAWCGTTFQPEEPHQRVCDAQCGEAYFG